MTLYTHKPKHIAIIMDGNGRWAKSKNRPRHEGHVAGMQAVKTTIQSCLKQQIPMLSLFAFSSENWGRPQTEVSHLMHLFVRALEQETTLLDEYQISIRFTGHLTQLSPDLQEMIAEAMQRTAHYDQLTLNIAMNYGGRWDILQATRTLIQKIQEGTLTLDALDELTFSKHLATATLPDPDLFIRTSGEQRISNYFLWQLAYTELYFTDVYWPDFDETHLHAALAAFQQRQRRFGLAPDEE